MSMKEKTVKFDDKNSLDDYGLIFAVLSIGTPKPKISTVDIPFRNGSLDVTDNFGGVKYENRAISMSFIIPWESEEQLELYSEFINDVNGKRKRITFSSDEDWYYYGRVEVGDISIDNGFWSFPVSVNADPYKYKEIEVEESITGSKTIELYNDYLPAILTIQNSASVIIEFEGNSYAFSPGTHENPDIVLKKGYNELIITGTANVAFTYQQGRL